MVWYGLYVVLFGGLLSTVKRLRQGRQVDEIAAAAAGRKAARSPEADANEPLPAPATAREGLEPAAGST
jgi:hypothetical protein